MRLPHIRGAIAALALLGASTLAACGATGEEGGHSADSPVDREATVRVGLASLPLSLDPHTQEGHVAAFRVLDLVYDRLVTHDPQGQIAPMLATEWSYLDKGRTLQLTLREGVTFDDGTPLDADVVVANLRSVLDHGAAVLQTPLEEVDEVDAEGPYQVRISLNRPTTEVLDALSLNAGLVMHPDLLDDGKGDTVANGTGPYEVTSFQPGSNLVLTRKDNIGDYWDKDAAQVKTFDIVQITDPRAATNALKSGQLQVASFQNTSVVEDMSAEIDQGKLTVQDTINASTLGLAMNRSVAPLDEVDVRRAVMRAIDREVLVDTFFKGGDPSSQWARESGPFYDTELGDAYSFDPEAAKKLLADAGHPNGVDLGTILVSQSVPASAAEAIQGMLADVGITIKMQTVDAAQVFAQYAEGKAAGSLNWSGAVTQAGVTRLRSSLGPAYIQPGVTPELGELLGQVDDNTLTEEERTEGFQAVNRYLTDQAWVAQLFFANFPWVHDSRLSGMSDGDYDYAMLYGPYDWRYWALHEG